MKIYVVELRAGEFTEVANVFLTKEEAEKYIEDYCWDTGLDESNFEIYEFDLDIDCWELLAKEHGVSKEYFINNINEFISSE